MSCSVLVLVDGVSQAANLVVSTVPQHAVQGGVVMQMVGSCDSIGLTMMTLPQLTEVGDSRVFSLVLCVFRCP